MSCGKAFIIGSLLSPRSHVAGLWSVTALSLSCSVKATYPNEAPYVNERLQEVDDLWDQLQVSERFWILNFFLSFFTFYQRQDISKEIEVRANSHKERKWKINLGDCERDSVCLGELGGTLIFCRETLLRTETWVLKDSYVFFELEEAQDSCTGRASEQSACRRIWIQDCPNWQRWYLKDEWREIEKEGKGETRFV